MKSVEKYQPMTEDQAEVLLKLLVIDKKDKLKFDQIYVQDVKDKDFICQVLEKRITYCKLPHFEPSAVMMIATLSSGNPGRAVLMLIETLEAWKKEEPEPLITAAFIAEKVYPWGFYTQEHFEKEWDRRHQEPKVGYNFLM